MHSLFIRGVSRSAPSCDGTHTYLSISTKPTHLSDHLPYLNMKTAFAVLALVAGASAFNGENARRFRVSHVRVFFVEDGAF